MKALLTLVVIATSLSAAASDFNGTWVGGTNALGSPAFVQVVIEKGGGSIEVPSEDVMLPLRDMKSDGPKLGFSIVSPLGTFVFSGQLEGAVVRGRLKTPMGSEGSMQFQRTATMRGTPGGYAGLYLAPSGVATIVIARRGQLRAVNTTTLASTRLVPVEGGAFLDAATVVEDPATGRRLEFAYGTNGEVVAMTNGAVTSQRTARIDQDLVRFTNGAITLGGTFLKPQGVSKVPVAVVVHGSGLVTRDMLLQRAQLLLRAGVAVFLYDKRGTGESGGDWQVASFDDLAGDALAAVRAMRSRPDVDPKRIGVVGHSQAGWIVPIVASKDPEVAFAVIASGGAISPLDQEVFRSEAQTKHHFTAQDAADAKAFTTALWTYARTGEGWDAYEKAWVAAAPKPWFRTVAGPRTRDDLRWTQTRLFAAYDPLPILRKVHAPSLVLFGKDDELVPSDRAADLWRRTAGSNVEVVMIPGTGHNLMVRHGEGSAYAPQYVTRMLAWLQQRGIIPKDSPMLW
ncbi:MAG: alpha/beta hydrolase [Acidobacteriota bacterium]